MYVYKLAEWRTLNWKKASHRFPWQKAYQLCDKHEFMTLTPFVQRDNLHHVCVFWSVVARSTKLLLDYKQTTWRSQSLNITTLKVFNTQFDVARFLYYNAELPTLGTCLRFWCHLLNHTYPHSVTDTYLDSVHQQGFKKFAAYTDPNHQVTKLLGTNVWWV